MADVVEVNCETGEVITRPMTAEEVAAQAASAAQAKADADAKAKADAEAQAIKSSAVSKLAKLGLTDEEIAALVG
jgi:hypothetical protein